MDGYDPQQIEAKWQRVWEARAPSTSRTPPRRGGRRAPLVSAGDAPVPVGVAPHGARPQLHDGRRPDAPAPTGGWRVLRPMGFDSFGLPAENAALRDGEHPREHRALHRPHARADEAAGLGDRLGPRGLSAPAGVLPLDAVAVPEVLRARPRVPQGGAGQLVPERPDGRRERVRHRRPLRALRSGSGGAEPRAVVLQDHRLRRRACSSTTCPRAASGRSGRRRSSATGSGARRRGDPVPHRRAERGRAGLHHPARHAVRRAFFVLAPEHPLVERIVNEEVQAYAKQTAARRGEERAKR